MQRQPDKCSYQAVRFAFQEKIATPFCFLFVEEQKMDLYQYGAALSSTPCVREVVNGVLA